MSTHRATSRPPKGEDLRGDHGLARLTLVNAHPAFFSFFFSDALMFAQSLIVLAFLIQSLRFSFGGLAASLHAGARSGL
jgi:hypothetical protein